MPTFARGGVPTKMGWDWSTAGRMNANGKPFKRKDEKGHVVYDSRKGDVLLGEDAVPDYVWFNGTVSYVQLDAWLGFRASGCPARIATRRWTSSDLHLPASPCSACWFTHCCAASPALVEGGPDHA
jgi:hypothetical protein